MDAFHELQLRAIIRGIEKIYYPILAAFGVTVNAVTIVILSRGKCGLSKCVTRYLVAMAAADLLVIITDLILRQIPIIHRMYIVLTIPVCNIHAVLLYAATDCSVWFTVTFSFDRFVAICCQTLKTKYCTERMAAVVLGTVTVLSGLKNIPWYFMFTPQYTLLESSWFCYVTIHVALSRVWGTIEFIQYILTPGIPFILVLLINAVTVRYILVASRARQRLRGPRSAESTRDPEMNGRRKSIILLLMISSNFILLWAVFMLCSILRPACSFNCLPVRIPFYVWEMGFMLQLLSCCTNTCIYAVTQTKFREQLKNAVKYAFALIIKYIK
uniref:probable G-protein coupled receptor 139 n=1 Tax=Pristiophorus japonicus TaxID=55135 RepID=UPI00398EF458